MFTNLSCEKMTVRSGLFLFFMVNTVYRRLLPTTFPDIIHVKLGSKQYLFAVPGFYTFTSNGQFSYQMAMIVLR